MSGYLYGESPPIEKCPYCATDCHADFVDIGVGYTQCGPYHCLSCGASEIGPYDTERELSAREETTGWYAPGAEPGSSANVIGDKIVGHKEMGRAYQAAFTGNPLYNVDGAVEEWWKTVRKPKEQL